MPMDLTNLKKEQLQRAHTKETFLKFDQEKFIWLFSLEHDEKTFKIDFIGKTYTVERASGETYVEGREASIDEMASIFEYLTFAQKRPQLVGSWESIASLCTNTTDTSLTRYLEYLRPFGDDAEKMRNALAALGAVPQSKGDVSGILNVFPDVPVWFQYWCADDEFPASVQFLFDGCIAEHFRWSILWNVMTCITARMLEEAGLKQE